GEVMKLSLLASPSDSNDCLLFMVMSPLHQNVLYRNDIIRKAIQNVGAFLLHSLELEKGLANRVF
ncbi:hypothetical protein OAO01_06950, partial [Oligoflexia bacterium]|nr:hypothetical protein [Oligoflexia bacterium]